VDEPFIAPSAHRHGVSDQIILHVFNNPIRTEELDDDLVMLIGPDLAGNLYEIGVVASQSGAVVVHAMTARPKYLR
jgi:hypothetical protein